LLSVVSKTQGDSAIITSSLEAQLNNDKPRRKLGFVGRTIGVIATLFSGVLAERFSEGVKHWAGVLVHHNDSLSFGIAVIWALILSLVLAKFVGYVDLFSSGFAKNTRTFLFVAGVILAGVVFRSNCG